MLRAALLACAVLATQVALGVAIVPGALCPERCPDDGPDGRCPPLCLTCRCASQPTPPMPARLVSVPPAQGEVVVAPTVVVPAAPDPPDIFHVPKRLLA